MYYKVVTNFAKSKIICRNQKGRYIKKNQKMFSLFLVIYFIINVVFGLYDEAEIIIQTGINPLGEFSLCMPSPCNPCVLGEGPPECITSGFIHTIFCTGNSSTVIESCFPHELPDLFHFFLFCSGLSLLSLLIVRARKNVLRNNLISLVNRS
jgi:hypothetical protein